MHRSTFRLARAAVGIAVSATLLVSCASDSESDSERTVLTFGVYDPTVETLFEKSGVLEGAPFDLEFAILTVPQQFPSLYSGATDFAFIGQTALLTEAANSNIDWDTEGAQLNEFAVLDAAYQSPNPLHVTVVKSDSGIDTKADLAGKRWAHSGGSSEEMFFDSLADAGLSVDDVDLTVFDDFNAAAAAYERNDVDVFVNGYRTVSNSLASGESKIVSDQNSLGANIRMAMVATPETLENKNADIRDFLSRAGDFTEWLRSHPTEAQAIYESGLKFTPEEAADFWANGLWNFEPADDAYTVSFQKTADTFYAQKAIPQPVTVGSIVDDQFDDVIRPKTLTN